LEEQNIKLLAPWLNLFGGISLKELPPSPGDPDVPKGIKIRAPAMKVFELMAENLGYLPTPIPWAEAFVALQSGIVDGVIGGGYESTWANFKDVVNYYLHYNSHLDMYFWIINLDLWNSLSEEDQKILMDAGLELEKQRLAGAEADEGVFAQKLRDYGIETMTFSENELAKFTEKAHNNVWPAVKDDIGAEFMERLAAELGSR
jgi:TRAP-type C4-dicarboxylate transport system substrate-binding protein